MRAMQAAGNSSRYGGGGRIHRKKLEKQAVDAETGAETEAAVEDPISGECLAKGGGQCMEEGMGAECRKEYE